MSADQKIKTAAKKPPLALIPFIWLYGVARVLAYGAVKYAKGNHYTATLDDGAGERYAGATQRHLADMQEPDGTWSRTSLAARDHESGLPSIDHAICSLGILRGILVKEGVLPADPGEAKVPPASGGWANVITGVGRPAAAHPPEHWDALVLQRLGNDREAFHALFGPSWVAAAERLEAKGILERDATGRYGGWRLRADTAVGRAPAPVVRDWATIESVVLDHPDPERPLPPRDVVEAEWRAPNASDLEAPEPAAGDAVTVVEDVAKAAEDRYQRLLAHRVAQGGYDVAYEADLRRYHAEYSSGHGICEDHPAVAQIKEAVADGPTSFAYIAAHCTAYGQELFDILSAMVEAGDLRKDASGFSLGGGKTPGRP